MNILQKIKEKLTQASDGSYSDDQRGAIGDEMTRLEQEQGYATSQYDIAGRKAEAVTTAADLAQERGVYGLGQEAEADWESSMGTFLSGFKKGGRVPSKKSFLQVLTKLPDAGGS